MDFHFEHHARGTWVAPTFLFEIARAGVDKINFGWTGTDLPQPLVAGAGLHDSKDDLNQRAHAMPMWTHQGQP